MSDLVGNPKDRFSRVAAHKTGGRKPVSWCPGSMDADFLNKCGSRLDNDE